MTDLGLTNQLLGGQLAAQKVNAENNSEQDSEVSSGDSSNDRSIPPAKTIFPQVLNFTNHPVPSKKGDELGYYCPGGRFISVAQCNALERKHERNAKVALKSYSMLNSDTLSRRERRRVKTERYKDYQTAERPVSDKFHAKLNGLQERILTTDQWAEHRELWVKPLADVKVDKIVVL